MARMTLPKPQGFHLAAATAFYESFVPASGMAAASVDRLTLAFRLDRTYEAVAVSLSEGEDGIHAEYRGTADEVALGRQVSRMLGLGADGEAWRAVGQRDAVVGVLQAEFPGFFTAAKASPYDAATWAILVQRTGMRAAAKLKTAIATKHGDTVTMRERAYRVFPSPAALEQLEAFPGLSEEKAERLRGIGRAARAGRLDAGRLRAMPESDALKELMTLRGVGPWAASHIFHRGAALSDALPTAEPRVLHGFAAAYDLASPSIEAFQRAAEEWRPFRMWVSILLARHLARTRGWNDPGLSRERARLGRRLARPRPGAFVAT
jgi:3-methyladenine DNA glycosylase/8-oxoguanine DNA glycosylase